MALSIALILYTQQNPCRLVRKFRKIKRHEEEEEGNKQTNKPVDQCVYKWEPRYWKWYTIYSLKKLSSSSVSAQSHLISHKSEQYKNYQKLESRLLTITESALLCLPVKNIWESWRDDDEYGPLIDDEPPSSSSCDAFLFEFTSGWMVSDLYISLFGTTDFFIKFI